MKECSFCGAKIIDETKPCPGCGYNSNPSGEIYGDAKEIDSQIIEEKPQQNAVDVENKILPTWMKIALVVITIFLSPIVGIIASIILLFNKSNDYKSFGKKLIIITLVYLAIVLVIPLFGVLSILSGVTMY